MQKFIILITVIFCIAVGLLLYAEYFGTAEQMFSFKLLAMSAIITMAIYKARRSFGPYRYAIIFGLGFSLCGDLLLVVPDYFLFGLIAFLIALAEERPCPIMHTPSTPNKGAPPYSE